MMLSLWTQGSWAAQAAPNPKHMSLQRHKDIEEFVVTEAGLGVLWPQAWDSWSPRRRKNISPEPGEGVCPTLGSGSRERMLSQAAWLKQLVTAALGSEESTLQEGSSVPVLQRAQRGRLLL